MQTSAYTVREWDTACADLALRRERLGWKIERQQLGEVIKYTFAFDVIEYGSLQITPSPEGARLLFFPTEAGRSDYGPYDATRVPVPGFREIKEAINARLRDLFGERTEVGTGEAGRIRRPRPKTVERAEVFKEIKDKHPDWGYGTVAMKAAELLEDDSINKDTVENAYRSMGWTWERADRIR